MVAAADDGGSVYTYMGPTLSNHADGSVSSSDSVSCISLFKKIIVVTSLGDINHSSDGIVPTCRLPVATVDYGP
jgi:hypothetical protein